MDTQASMLHLFEGPYVTVGGRRQDIPRGSRRLLAFVALNRRRVDRRCAADALWPGSDGDRASGNLRSALWRLRGARIEVLASDKWSIWLNGGVTVDAHLVGDWAGRLIAGAEERADLDVSPTCMDALDLLPGYYDDWALLERERLRQRMLHALESLSRRLSRIGRHADAVEAAMLAVSAEPLRESAQRALIEAHLAEGNVVEARDSHRRYADLIRRELGIVPSPALSRLVHPHPRGVPPPRTSPDGTHPRATSPPRPHSSHATTSPANG
ncbi:SARP family transcriptional regulator [Actinomadura graeca]|uniref:SARP family transcriptional regulator n=1 Tax=Actinomadura graeca TaxID=2750812 RepID=A0ABX8QWY2_9ACTN|nr:BTAD domain-containing putative transcriptional regulator [Actinomadura graeca]QXJ21278.1 SARP family transcriptional regulator [Actinomadura graeca]